ncbi:hypothetical protein [Methylobacterium sp. 77]|uniref:hypothetical protein n=1 Tax=Methylobacterium sp. 77 TaxID=1101192 RepID=UPI0009DC1DFA|nr:hypothetical protein [Methylobacterium sp. 77]
MSRPPRTRVRTGKQGSVAAFPAHWAPNDVEIDLSDLFRRAYRGGTFIAFHGSWIDALAAYVRAIGHQKL